jgi:hypothetical protein
MATFSRAASILRLAAMSWSVPVLTGFGRRLRYLVWDEAYQRVAGTPVKIIDIRTMPLS